LQLQQTLQQYACDFLPASRKISALNNRNIDRTSQVAGFSISGGKYDTVPHNTRSPLETKKKPDIYRKYAPYTSGKRNILRVPFSTERKD
jgi:hypothetical protein